MIEIGGSDRKPVTVNLVGVEYSVNPPKSALALSFANTYAEIQKTLTTTKLPAAKVSRAKPKTAQDGLDTEQLAKNMKMVDMLYSFIDAVFGKQSKAVRARLNDNDDQLDIEHISELMTALFELTGGGEENRPTM